MTNKFSPLRWGILLLVMFSLGLLTIDRQALSIAAPVLQNDLGMTAAQFGQVLAIFSVVFALAALPLGVLFDWIGGRFGLALTLLICLLADIAAGSAGSVWGLGAARAFYALGAPGGALVAAKAIAEWMPARERGSAFGLLAAGREIAAAAAAFVLFLILNNLGWRGLFLLLGGTFLPLLFLWVWAYRTPSQHAALSEWEAGTIEKEKLPDVSLSAGGSELTRWLSFWGRREAWLLILSSLITAQLSTLLISWLPMYLNRQKGFSLQNVSWMSLAVFLPSAMGALFGGGISDLMIRSGGHPLSSRLRLMAVAAVLVLAIVPLVWVNSLNVLMVLIGITSIGAGIWQTTMNALVVDLTPARSVGSVMGGILTCSSIVGAVMSVIVGFVMNELTNGMELLLVLSSLLYLVALALLVWATRPQRLAAATA